MDGKTFPDVQATFYNQYTGVNVGFQTTTGDFTDMGDFYLALPIELFYFEGKLEGDNAILNWGTNSELNNRGFEIERKDRNGEWITIGFVEGHQTSIQTHHYSFIDEKPFSSNRTSGTNFFRLKQIDLDNSFEYSKVIAIENELQIYPNPVNNEMRILNGQGRATIYNVLGQQVKAWTINTTDLPRGQYIFLFKKKMVVTKRFVK